VLALGAAVIMGTAYMVSWHPLASSAQTQAASPGTVQDVALFDRLKRHVRLLSEEIGNRDLADFAHLERAATYIAAQFADAGYQVQFQPYGTGGRTVSNIIATTPGASTPDEIIIVGAHYDTCGNPGADDNASGMAALLELARRDAAASHPRTIRWIAFVNEEPPFFKTDAMGSRVYAQEAKRRGERIRAMLCLESIGYYSDSPQSQQYPPFLGLLYPSRGNFLAVVSNFRWRRLARDVARSLKGTGRCPVEWVAAPEWMSGVTWSDHWSFWQEGYPAVMLTDTAFLRNPHYHNASDTWDTLDYERLSAAVEGLNTVVQDLATR
jgi:Zn-dependent M28 family amino/carboxypeptidase